MLPCSTVGFRGEIAYDRTKPDGATQKLLDISKLSSLGWKAKTSLEAGAAIAYADFLSKQQIGTPDVELPGN